MYVYLYVQCDIFVIEIREIREIREIKLLQGHTAIICFLNILNAFNISLGYS